jgi:GT2 family glycosyltransferase
MTDLTRLNIDQWSISNINDLISGAETKFVLLYDTKATLSDSDIAELMKFIKRDDRLALIQPKILVENTKFIHPFGGTGGLIDQLGVGYTRGASFGESETDNGQFDIQLQNPDWINAPIMLIRRDAFEQVCGLDASFNGQYAWMDLGTRLRRMGYWLSCFTQIEAQYPGVNTNEKQSTVTSNLFPISRFVIRHNDGPWLLVMLMWITIELIRIPGNLIQLRFKLVNSRLEALFKTIGSMPAMIRDRYEVQDGITNSAKSGIISNNRPLFSIFWNHYGRLGKTASNLLTIFLVIASVFSLTMRDRR